MESKKAAGAIINILQEVNRNLEELNEKLERVVNLQETMISHSKPRENLENLPLDVATLLALPDHLRKTALAICKLGEATATDVSKETGRVRAAESDYLNQLVAMGHLKKKRKGRDVYFYIGS